VLVLVAVLATPVAFAQDKPPAAPPRQLSLANKPWKGDFDQMLQRRIIRVLIPYSRTLFFNDKGRERGITAENMRDCERYLNQKYARQLNKRPLTFVLTLIGSRALAACGDVDGSSAANNRPWSRKCTARLFRRSDARASAHGCAGTRSVRRAGAGSVG
jgi:hypothetical protein